MAKAFDCLGHKLILPSKEYKPVNRPSPPIGDFVWNETWDSEKINKYFYTDNVICRNKEEILELKPEIIFITAYENQFEILEELWPHMKSKSKIAFYSGNSYWPEAYPFDKVENYLSADFLSYNLCTHHKKNFLYYRPWVDYDTFTFGGTNASNILGSYISNFKTAFPEDYGYSKELQSFLDFLDVKLYTDIPNEEVPLRMRESMATLHVKRQEGYGYAIIESMASGRPVFLYAPYAPDKSYKNWAIENMTAFFFTDPYELRCKLKALIESTEYRHYIQHTCARVIRKLINNEEQTANLKKFLENLV